MSETRELDKVRYEFKEFLKDLHAFPTTSTAPYERDSVDKPFVTVSRAAALNCFLGKHPSYERFRDDLSEVRRDAEKFDFNKEKWDKECVA
jgi:hypothetical protein